MSVLRRRMPPEATKSQSSSANSAAPHDKPDKAHPMEGFTTH
jgi:hypothetical protein